MELITTKRMRERRLELGLSAEQVGKAIGVNRSTVYRFEQGGIDKMPLAILEPLAKVLNCSPAYLMGWSSNPSDFNKEKKIIDAYHSNPDMHSAIDRLLRLDSEISDKLAI